ncbi:hypothetical protein BDL97_07G050700 [Sphagnum fallax]|nr:hypothetical protein BDL97_07G050700 [Sphagnum fallax]
MAPSRGEEMAEGLQASSSSSPWIPEVEADWKQQVAVAGKLWWAGFRDACCLHRALASCKRSRRVYVKTGQCFLLNGCIFLGSILVLQQLVVPTLRWLLNAQSQAPSGSDGVDAKGSGEPVSSMLQTLVVGLCYVFWLYPLYIISAIINCIWYNEIARHAFEILDEGGKPVSAQGSGKVKAPGTLRSKSSTPIESIVLGIGEQIYSILMVSVFFVEVFAASFIPYVGPLLNFVLLSWLYAYYCFDYKWGFARWSLEKRLNFFETNWAFFAGFGSPCVIATFFFSPLVSAGVMAILFPLFVLVATASNPEEVVSRCMGGNNRDSGLCRLPIFYFANKVTLPLLKLLQPQSRSTSRKKTQ